MKGVLLSTAKMHNHWLLLYGCFENLKTLLLRSLGMLEYRQVWTQGITFLASFEYYIIITCWDEGFSNAAPTSIQKRFSPAFAYCFPAKQSNIFLPPPHGRNMHMSKLNSFRYFIESRCFQAVFRSSVKIISLFLIVFQCCD